MLHDLTPPADDTSLKGAVSQPTLKSLFTAVKGVRGHMLESDASTTGRMTNYALQFAFRHISYDAVVSLFTTEPLTEKWPLNGAKTTAQFVARLRELLVDETPPMTMYGELRVTWRERCLDRGREE